MSLTLFLTLYIFLYVVPPFGELQWDNNEHLRSTAMETKNRKNQPWNFPSRIANLSLGLCEKCMVCLLQQHKKHSVKKNMRLSDSMLFLILPFEQLHPQGYTTKNSKSQLSGYNAMINSVNVWTIVSKQCFFYAAVVVSLILLVCLTEKRKRPTLKKTQKRNEIEKN